MLFGAAIAVTILGFRAPLDGREQSSPDTTGPYRVRMEEDPSLPNHTVYRPADLADVRGTLPVVAFGNGACANAGNAFERYLAEIASHGFLVVANGAISNSPLPPGRPGPPGGRDAQGPGAGRAAGGAPPGVNDSAGGAVTAQPTGGEGGRATAPAAPQGGRGGQQSSVNQLYETMDWATADAATASPYRGKLAIDKIAVSVRSCGGLQALEAAGDPCVTTAVFRGVPFAAPPVGDLRWAPPKPAVSWGSQPRQPTAFGPACTQTLKSNGSGQWTSEYTSPAEPGVSEDCLYLNVWTAATLTGAAGRAI